LNETVLKLIARAGLVVLTAVWLSIEFNRCNISTMSVR
jgi:hypothetical protein